MTSSPFERELAIALAAVRNASRICRDVQNAITADVLEKKDRSPVTVADYSSQAVVCRALAEQFPDDPVIGEEDSSALRDGANAAFLERVLAELERAGIGADKDTVCGWIDRGGTREFSERFWTIDPIDGTKGFLRKEQYAVALALLVNGDIQVAVLGCPNLETHRGTVGSLLYAVRGQGAWVTSVFEESEPVPIRASTNDASAQARFCESVESGHSAHGQSSQVAEQLGITRPPVRLDSQAKYAVVARGDADIYLRLPTRADYREKIWDHAAGVLLVEEAGGRVTDVAGRPLNFRLGRELSENRGVIVSNGALHDRVLAALKAVGVA
jgi:3'(2'), 5'-bisphosphate nucleotidase